MQRPWHGIGAVLDTSSIFRAYTLLPNKNAFDFMDKVNKFHRKLRRLGWKIG